VFHLNVNNTIKFPVLCLSLILNLVCDWKHTNNDLNGYSCQSFSEILTELTGEQISKKWIESCFHFSGNGRINNKADTLVGFMHSLQWKTDMLGHGKTYKLPGRNNGVRIFHPIDDVSKILSTNELKSKIKCVMTAYIQSQTDKSNSMTTDSNIHTHDVQSETIESLMVQSTENYQQQSSNVTPHTVVRCSGEIKFVLFYL